VTEEAPLVLFSGLGADERLFRDQKARFPGLAVPQWIDPRRGESLADYAARLAEQVAALRPRCVGGASLGGMLALEVACRLRPRAVFLLGSCRSPASIPASLRLGGAAVRRLPSPIFRIAQSRAPSLARFLGPCSQEIYQLVTRMHREIPSGFLRWGVGAILDWPGVENPGVPVHHIHGGADRLLPVRLVHPDRVVPGAGHLLTLTHPQAVNDYLEEKMAWNS
jgi:pimeloyl-ACP methyl ester carboxylesterase